MNQKMAVIKISVEKQRNGFTNEHKKLLELNESYKIASNPFFNFIYEETKKF